MSEPEPDIVTRIPVLDRVPLGDVPALEATIRDLIERLAAEPAPITAFANYL